jgi:CTP synthase
MFCHVSSEQVFGVHDVTSVYHVPILLQSQGIVEYLRKRLNLDGLNITAAMQERGESLRKRWKEVTTGCVAECPKHNAFRNLTFKSAKNDFSTQ